MKYPAFVLFGLLLLLSACSFFGNKEVLPEFTKGIYIVQQNASQSWLSYFDTLGKQVVLNIYSQQNKQDLDARAHSMTVFNERGYIVLSDQVKVVDVHTLGQVGVINGLEEPRYFAGIDNKTGYVTCQGNSGNAYVAIVDLNTFGVEGAIPLAAGSQPERMLVGPLTTDVFVATSANASITHINTDSKTATTIKTSDVPSGMVMDVNQKIWVLCRGKINGSSAALVRISPTDFSIEKTVPIGGATEVGKPANLAINRAKNRLYFTLNNAIYNFASDSSTVDLTVRVLSNKAITVADIDPNTDMFYVYDKVSGYVSRYRVPSVLIDSFPMAPPAASTLIPPVGFAFQPIR